MNNATAALRVAQAIREDQPAMITMMANRINRKDLSNKGDERLEKHLKV